ncbi:MAG: hypothetical protein ACOCS6_02775, partial [Desulfosalsimonas sp.]
MNEFVKISGFGWFLAVLFLVPFAAEAQNVVRGGVSVEHAYDSNIDRVPQNEVSEWTTTVTPGIEYARSGRRSDFSLRYAPGVVYNWRT